ncbi:hypothetical protein BH10PSE17_BH10PSE17_01140 [soil metagenome]
MKYPATQVQDLTPILEAQPASDPRTERIDPTDEAQLQALARAHGVKIQAVCDAIIQVGTNKGAVDAALATRITRQSSHVDSLAAFDRRS